MNLSLQEVLDSTRGALGGPATGDPVFPMVSTDTRSLRAGALFLALRGPNHDAHDFLGEAVNRGAAAAVVERQVPDLGIPVIRVDDTLEALGRLANHVRRRQGFRVLAVTGSVGKTTTKEMAAAVLRAQGRRVLQSPGNWNNRVGLPLTILSARGDEEVAVLELGISEPGEMAHLTRICAPDAAVVTAVALCHTAGLGSIDEVAREKLAVAGGLTAGGTLVLPAGDARLRPPPEVRALTFGWTREADIRGEQFIALGAAGCRFRVSDAEFSLQLPGRHNATNALAALAGLRALGCGWESADRALRALEPAPLRGEIRRTRRGAHLLVDCYNANPSAVVCALETLRDLAGAGRTLAVLGEMRELGAWSKRGHADVGRAAARLGVGELHLLGPATAWTRDAAATGIAPERIWVYDDREALAASLARRLRPGDWLLIKGSRALGLEAVVDLLEEQTNGR